MTQPERYSKCRCQNCGGHIEFPTEGAGQTINCPHCGWATVLTVEKVAVPARRKSLWLILLGVVGVTMIVVAGALYLFAPQLRPKVVITPGTPLHPNGQTNSPHPAVANVQPKAPDPWHGLVPGHVALEKSSTGHLLYAVGEVHNTSNHERFGVRVELDILDGAHQKLGTASDYTQSIEAGKKWRFRALVTDRNGKSAEITAVKEE